jgi:type IV pilus assembly protein PilA
MRKKLLLVGLALGLLGSFVLAGCQKKEEATVAAKPEAPKPAAQPEPAPPPPKPEPPKAATIEVVKELERSKHFMTVTRQLELGGTLYGYVDVDGDLLKFAGSLQDTMNEIAKAQPAAAPFLKQDYGALFTTLGLTDLKALGLSSVPDGTGFFRNRAFFYMPDGRRGLLAGLGGPPAPFTHVSLAPKDTDVYSECEMDLPAVYAALKQVVEKVGGAASANMMETALAKAGEPVGFSALSLVQSWKGRTAMVLRVDPEKNLKIPGAPGPSGPSSFTIPAFSLLLCFDGIAPSLEGLLTKSPLFATRTEDKVQLFELKQPLPLEGIQPVVAIDGSTLYIATSGAFLTECLHPPANLGQDAAFQQALDRVGHEGNSLAYVSPRFFTRFQQLEALNPDLPADGRRVLGMVMRNLPKPDRPLITVRSNQPDGILVRSYWDRSLKQDVAVLAIYNPLTVGIMAAMAIPAFQKVRDSSQEKAVTNNLRQLEAAADQYYLENNVTTATFDQLVGPDKYVKAVNPVVGEDYRQIEFKQGEPLHVQLPSGKVIQYPQ